MTPIRVIAIPTAIAHAVRTTNKDPRYGYPTHVELARGHGPCRHCLKTFSIGKEKRTLFTYDPFGGVDEVPLPGPIFIHTEECDRYPEDIGYPEGLRQYPAMLAAFGERRRLVAEALVDDGSQPAVIEELFRRPEVEYIHVRDKCAGCYDFRVERA